MQCDFAVRCGRRKCRLIRRGTSTVQGNIYKLGKPRHLGGIFQFLWSNGKQDLPVERTAMLVGTSEERNIKGDGTGLLFGKKNENGRGLIINIACSAKFVRLFFTRHIEDADCLFGNCFTVRKCLDDERCSFITGLSE